MFAETRIADNEEIVTSYFLYFEWVDDRGGGFNFTCDKDGNVDPDMNPCAKANYDKCVSGEYQVVRKGVHKHEQRFRLCPCGSGEYPEDIHDARGIFVARVCDKCRKRKLKGYREEIFTDSNYESNEPIDYD